MRASSPRTLRAEAIRLQTEGRTAESRALLAEAAAAYEFHSSANGSCSSSDQVIPTAAEKACGGSGGAAAAGLADGFDEPQALSEWCRDFLGQPPTLHLHDFPDTGRGLTSDLHIPAGDPVLTIPLHCVLTSRRCLPAHPLLDTMHEDLRLATSLLVEPLRDPKGPWARCACFPSSPTPNSCDCCMSY